MIRFWLKCLCIFSVFSTPYAAPASDGIHRVSRQDFTWSGAPQGAAAAYQRPFESQNGVYSVQRQDFTNINDMPFKNSYLSPYMNRFSIYNPGYGNTNRSIPTLFVPSSQSRPENPFLAIGRPNYNRIVPASSFQVKTQVPQITILDDESVLPALPHPPRYDLPSVSQKTKSFEEDFSSAVEQFDLTEDRKAICKGENCRKSNPNDHADAVKPIRRRRSMHLQPLPEFDKYSAGVKIIPFEPIESEMNFANKAEIPPTTSTDSTLYEAKTKYEGEMYFEDNANTEPGNQELTNELSQRDVQSEEVTTSTSKPSEMEFEYNDSFEPLPKKSESSTPRDKLVIDYPTGDDEPKDHSIETRESSTDFNSHNVDDESATINWQILLGTVEPTTESDGLENPPEANSETSISRGDLPEDHPVNSPESPTDPNLDTDEIDWDKHFHPNTVETTTETNNSENPPEATSENSFNTGDLPEDHFVHNRELWIELNSDPDNIDWDKFFDSVFFDSTDNEENPPEASPDTSTTEQPSESPTSVDDNSIQSTESSTDSDWDKIFHSDTFEPTTETDNSENHPEASPETDTTEQPTEPPTPVDLWPEADFDLNSDIDDTNLTPIECEFFDPPTEPVTEPETTPETEIEEIEQQTELALKNKHRSYSLSTVIICNIWSEKYNKKLTDEYDRNGQSWATVCNFLNFEESDNIEPETETTASPTTTTEATNTDFLDDSEVLGNRAKDIEDLRNLLEAIAISKIDTNNADIQPELPEINLESLAI